MDKLINFFQNIQVSSVLDVGTGSGNFLQILQSVFPKASFTGVDPDIESLHTATEKFPKAVFQEMKGEKLKFDDNSFDVAGISMVLHHLSDVQQTLQEMRRVVRPGGWVIVNELFSDKQSSAQDVHKQMHHFRSHIDRMNGIVHNEAFSRRQIVNHIEKAGLKLELKFEFRNSRQLPSKEEIQERKEKLWSALESIKDREEYQKLAAEIPEIEAALDKYGFEMSTRLVCVSSVNK